MLVVFLILWSDAPPTLYQIFTRKVARMIWMLGVVLVPSSWPSSAGVSSTPSARPKTVRFNAVPADSQSNYRGTSSLPRSQLLSPNRQQNELQLPAFLSFSTMSTTSMSLFSTTNSYCEVRNYFLPNNPSFILFQVEPWTTISHSPKRMKYDVRADEIPNCSCSRNFR